jgi:hypothetical protein
MMRESSLSERFRPLVRHRSSQIVSLLQDEEKIREERKKAKSNRNRYVGVASEAGGSFGRFGGMSSDDYSYRISSFHDRDDEGFATPTSGHQEPMESSSSASPSTAWRLSGYWADTPNPLRTESSHREPSGFARYSDQIPDQLANSSPTKKPREPEGSRQHIVAPSYDSMPQQRAENLARDDSEKDTSGTPVVAAMSHPPAQMPRVTFDQHLNIGKYAEEQLLSTYCEVLHKIRILYWSP